MSEQSPFSPAAASLDVEDPASADAQACLAAYFTELARRFEAGFDPAAGAGAGGREMAPPSGGFVVARMRGEPVGCGGFCRLDEATAEVKRMWTAPSARGLRIARRILREIEHLARAAGYTVIRLDTNRALPEAVRFYRQEGYRDIARYNDNPYGDYWFEKRLV